MNEQLDKYLCKKYPKIFADRDKSMQESCMYWGLDVGNGWFYIIDSLCHEIQQWCDNPQYVKKTDLVTRIKNLWNMTVWNWIVYPLIKKLPFDEYKRYSDFWQFNHITYRKPKVNPRSQVVADQVKEKFSGLRFYYHGGGDSSTKHKTGWACSEYVRGLIDMAEAISYRTCESCGRMDNEIISTKGWITTTCPNCVRKDQITEPRNSADPKLKKIWDKIKNEDK